MKIKELIKYGNKLLNENKIEDASIISKILVEFILNKTRQQVIISENEEVSEENKHKYYLALIEIIQGIPLQYITNRQEFMKLNFYVDKNVLIPQPDTEVLIEEVIKISKEKNNKIDILDMCTGSGCIGISIAKNIKNSNITMTDISKEALKIAEKNAKQNEVNKVKFIESNMFENITKKYDIIVSNPPYIESEKIKDLPEQVKKEPKIALDGGYDGLEFYKILIKESHKYLNEDGYLCMEIGYNQKEAVIKLLEENNNYKEIYSKKDLEKNDRIVIAKLKK